VVQKEMQPMRDVARKRPDNLEMLNEALKTIKPTSVEVEHAFSVLGYCANKTRNRGDTLDVLLFVRQYYNK